MAEKLYKIEKINGEWACSDATEDMLAQGGHFIKLTRMQPAYFDSDVLVELFSEGRRQPLRVNGWLFGPFFGGEQHLKYLEISVACEAPDLYECPATLYLDLCDPWSDHEFIIKLLKEFEFVSNFKNHNHYRLINWIHEYSEDRDYHNMSFLQSRQFPEMLAFLQAEHDEAQKKPSVNKDYLKKLEHWIQVGRDLLEQSK